MKAQISRKVTFEALSQFLLPIKQLEIFLTQNASAYMMLHDALFNCRKYKRSISAILTVSVLCPPYLI